MYIKFTQSILHSFKIGIVGKYFKTGDYTLEDSYVSVIESLKHACYAANKKPGRKNKKLDNLLLRKIEKPATLVVIFLNVFRFGATLTIRMAANAILSDFVNRIKRETSVSFYILLRSRALNSLGGTNCGCKLVNCHSHDTTERGLRK